MMPIGGPKMTKNADVGNFWSVFLLFLAPLEEFDHYKT